MGSSNEQVEAEVKKTINELADALAKKDASAVAACFSEDTFMKFPGQKPLKGREAVKKAHDQIFSQGVTGKLKTISIELSSSHDLAYEVGEYELSAGGNTVDRGNYFTAFKQVDGKWLICDDVISSSMSAEE